MNGRRVFFDTNIFVYALDLDEDARRRTAQTLLRWSANEGIGTFSYQVWQEFVHVSTRKFRVPATLDQTLQAFHHFTGSLHIVHSSNALFTRAYQLWSRFQFQWYDSLIVAAGVEAGCDVLYSEDLQDGLDIDDMRIVNPFKTSEAGLN